MLNYGGWQHELINKHGCGVALWQKPIDEAAKILAAKITDDAWLKKAGKSSRQLAEEYFARDTLAMQLEQVLIAAVEGDNAKAETIAPGEY